MKSESLEQLLEAGAFSSMDLHFARFMERLNGQPCRDLFLAAGLLSSVTRRGHICLDLALPEVACSGGRDDNTLLEACPDMTRWEGELRRCMVVGRPGEFKPLILDDRRRLYLYRYWEYQDRLARWICLRASASPGAVRGGELAENAARLGVERGGETFFRHEGREAHQVRGDGSWDRRPTLVLEELFPSSDGNEPDWQMIAVYAAATRKFCAISGGPGTGKTTTVARVLYALAAMALPRALRIALAAPTGKASARLQEAIQRAKGSLPARGEILEGIPLKASTIHRLLGTIPDSPYFRHDERNPLPVDVVVVDEASMVDLPLMSKLVQALPPHASLILLGDKDQLSSVEAGAVLGDICDAGHPLLYSVRFAQEVESACGTPFPAEEIDRDVEGTAGRKPKDCIVQLRRSYRFSGRSGIAALSQAVRNNEPSKVMSILQGGAYEDVRWLGPAHAVLHDHLPSGELCSCYVVGDSTWEERTSFIAVLRKLVERGYGDYFRKVKDCGAVSKDDPRGRLKELFAFLDRFRILCALREGPRGVTSLNDVTARILAEKHGVAFDRNWYAGRPVLVHRNDYTLGLFNGDIGICLPDGDSGGDLRVFFPDGSGSFRSLHMLRLPEHETVYAMTVHKSQGSEFNEVLFVLPEKDAPVLSRELVYTAITRARSAIDLWTPAPILQGAVSRATRRLSGLSDALWGNG